MPSFVGRARKVQVGNRKCSYRSVGYELAVQMAGKGVETKALKNSRILIKQPWRHRRCTCKPMPLV
jgi:hypothetical protein